MSKKLPRTIFVTRIDDESVEWLSAAETLEELAQSEPRKVGVYVLQEVKEIELRVHVNG